MVDALTSLAFSVYSGKGVYALLLGSGVSRAAEIPTGWEVTLDLIRKIAATETANCEPDPVQWFLRRFGKDPEYSFLLESLAVTQAERTNALRGYFEATADERAAGKKIPTLAHRTIAHLVAKGYFRVIITTNFDRLIEQALEAEGINATIISTSDMAHGAIPLTHAGCTLVKVHGDYRDTRLRNTAKELSTYEPEMDRLLDRIFDEYGIIVCGWSATWDAALRAAILRSPNRRYSATWVARGALSPEAAALVSFRQASVLETESADKFFASLAEKVDALEQFNAPHPLSTAIAVASLKRFIVDDRFRIELRDLVTAEVERQVESLSTLSVQVQQLPPDAVLERLKRYEIGMDMLVNLVANGCYWGTPHQAELWVEVVSRVLDISPPQSGTTILLNLRRYPVCMLLYAGGIAAIAAKKYETLRVLLKDTRTSIDMPIDGKDDLLIRKLVLGRVLDAEVLNRCLGGQQYKTPLHDRLHSFLHDTLRPFLPNDHRYDDAFDRFEYLFALVYLDAQEKDGLPLWAPAGRFAWRNRSIGAQGSHISELLWEEYKKEKSNWEPIRAGLFENSQRFADVDQSFRNDVLSQIRPF